MQYREELSEKKEQKHLLPFDNYFQKNFLEIIQSEHFRRIISVS
jgi:hypothetical protein